MNWLGMKIKKMEVGKVKEKDNIERVMKENIGKWDIDEMVLRNEREIIRKIEIEEREGKEDEVEEWKMIWMMLLKRREDDEGEVKKIIREEEIMINEELEIVMEGMRSIEEEMWDLRMNVEGKELLGFKSRKMNMEKKRKEKIIRIVEKFKLR